MNQKPTYAFDVEGHTVVVEEPEWECKREASKQKWKTPEEHPLEVPLQIVGLTLGTAGLGIGLTVSAVIGVVLFTLGALIFLNAPHNYPVTS